MRVLVICITLIINLILQSTLFSYIEIIGIKPNTAILIVVSYAILRGDVEGAAVGFLSGLLQDLFFGNVIGMYALMHMVIGYICGKPFKDFFHANFFLPIFLGSMSIFIYGVVFYLSNFLFLGRLDFLYYLRKIILPETVYTIAIILPVYRVVFEIDNRLKRIENKKRKLFDEG